MIFSGEDESKERWDYFISINTMNKIYAAPYAGCIFILFRPVPYPKDFYNDVQGKDEKASAHSRDIGNFSIIQSQYLFIFIYVQLQLFIVI